MKKLNKVLSTIIALAISATQLVCVNAADTTTHGDVYAMYPTAESTKNGHDLSLQGGLVNDAWRIAELQYDATTDAVLSKNVGAKRTPLTYKPTSPIDRSKYNYAAILQKHVLYAGTDSIHWTIHTDFQNTFETYYTENPVWEKTVMDIEGETTNWKTFDQWIVGFNEMPSNVTSDNYTKYIAFFETEADANAYDLSIKDYSINGIPGELDNIAHTITFDMGELTPSVFEGKAPVMTADPLATITTTSEIDYVNDIVYNVTDVTGKALTYKVMFNYASIEHGEVFAMYPTAESTKSGHDLSLQGGLVNDAWRNAGLVYNAESDAVYSENNSTKQTPLTYKPTSPIDRSKYTYAAILQKHVIDHASQSIHWTIHTDYCNTFEAYYTENPVWEKTVIDLVGDDTGTWTTFDQWIVGFNTESVAKTSKNYTKYIAFFENEADANAYDLSIKGYSINGIPGEVDNIAHTITFNMEGQTADAFAGATPVMTADPLATITTTSEINYVDNIVYNVTNALGEKLTYVVKFIYEAEEPAPEGAYVFKFDTAAKVAATSFKLYNWNQEGTFDPQPSFDSNEKALNIRTAYGHGCGFVIDEEVPEIGKYKYAKLKYKYIDGTSSATNDYSNAISLTETDGRGKFIRQHMGLEIMNGRISDRRWFTDIVDISELSKNADGDSRVRFNCCVNEANNNTYGTTLLVDYIALFETYEDAVNYENDTAFEAPEINAVSKTVMTASMSYTEDRANPKLMLAIYKDGKLIETAMSGDITYEMDFTPNEGEKWTPYMGGSRWILNNEMVTELTTAEIDVADYEDGTYTAKIFMLGGTDTLKPYFAAEEYTITVATRNGVKQFKAEKVTE